ncbi:hypothetical protein C8J57DRAFT_1334036, partial [Mycena rebaudengoi]
MELCFVLARTGREPCHRRGRSRDARERGWRRRRCRVSCRVGRGRRRGLCVHHNARNPKVGANTHRPSPPSAAQRSRFASGLPLPTGMHGGACNPRSVPCNPRSVPPPPPPPASVAPAAGAPPPPDRPSTDDAPPAPSPSPSPPPPPPPRIRPRPPVYGHHVPQRIVHRRRVSERHRAA